MNVYIALEPPIVNDKPTVLTEPEAPGSKVQRLLQFGWKPRPGRRLDAVYSVIDNLHGYGLRFKPWHIKFDARMGDDWYYSVSVSQEQAETLWKEYSLHLYEYQEGRNFLQGEHRSIAIWELLHSPMVRKARAWEKFWSSDLTFVEPDLAGLEIAIQRYGL